MSSKYPSIETIFKRDKNTNKLDFGVIREPEFDIPKLWYLTEKIDGANTRAIITHEGIEVRGRTDNANVTDEWRSTVLGALPSHDVLVEYLGINEVSAPHTFYGEYYGAGVQKGGHYSPDKKFRAFDLMFGADGYWHSDVDFRGICSSLDIPVVPLVGYATAIPQTLQELTDVIPESIVAIEDSNNRGVPPEGIVAKPPTTILNKWGERVMWKLTLREFFKE